MYKVYLLETYFHFLFLCLTCYKTGSEIRNTGKNCRLDLRKTVRGL